MALQTLLARNELKLLHVRHTELSDKTAEYESRQAELETALDEAQTEDDLNAVRGLITEFQSERDQWQRSLDDVTEQIAVKENELRELENAAPPVNAPAVPASNDAPATVRKEAYHSMQLRAFARMSPERRDALLQSEEVRTFAETFRERFKGASGANVRAVSGADLLIPETLLDVLRENIDAYSKLLKYVRVIPLTGKARMPIMGTVPEAVWTEMVGALNNIDLSFSQVEMDGFKVGAYTAIPNSTLEDTYPVLVNAIIESLGRGIGKALDKAIIFGTGSKMPTGFVTRLAQTSQPENYPADARAWTDLHQSNVVTISSDYSGINLFKQIAIASGNVKSSYSNGVLFWAMTDATKKKLLTEAMSINAAGAVVTGLQNTMPVLGGDIVTLGAGGEVVPDDAIYYGYGDLFVLSERAGTSVGFSDLPLFVQDNTVFKATARYDGKPAIAEGFGAIGLGSAPATTADFAPDVANVPNPTLVSLTIGELTLSPTFTAATISYTTSTTNASDKITVIPATGATAEIYVGGTPYLNGDSPTWAAGTNAVKIKVTSTAGGSAEQKIYTVTVTKS